MLQDHDKTFETSEKWIDGQLVYLNKNIPETRFANDEILVKFKSIIRDVFPVEYKFSCNTGINVLDLLNQEYNTVYMERLWRPLDKMGDLEKKFEVDLLYLLKFSNEVDIKKAVKDFGSLDIVEYAEPNLYYPVLEMPNDPSLYSQWFHSRMQNYETWDITHGDTSVIYAIIDSDCQWNHPDIEPNIWINQDEDINGDGKVDLKDAIYLAKHVVSLPGYEQIHADGDVNCDGKLDLKDAIYLAKHVVGLPGYEKIYPCE